MGCEDPGHHHHGHHGEGSHGKGGSEGDEDIQEESDEDSDDEEGSDNEEDLAFESGLLPALHQLLRAQSDAPVPVRSIPIPSSEDGERVHLARALWEAGVLCTKPAPKAAKKGGAPRAKAGTKRGSADAQGQASGNKVAKRRSQNKTVATM